MAYTAPDVAAFRARWTPRFDSVPDPKVQMALDRAATQVDQSWTEGDFAEAQLLYAAGWLTTQGLGGGAEAEAAGAGAAGFRVMKSGQLTLERYDKPSGGSSSADPVLATADGAAFAALRQMNLGGPRTTGGGYPAGGCYGGWPWGC